MQKWLITGLFTLFLVSVACSGDLQERYETLRRDMVENQIIRRGISDENVIKAMLKVPRHEFVPLPNRFRSYVDSPLPIGEGQTISQPYIVAFMTEAIHPQKDDIVLEIGTGSGYQSAVLAEIVKEVYTIEIIESLAERAKKTLERLGYSNVFVRTGDGYQGWPEHAPYDAVIVTCAPDHIPQPLIDQLKIGGRMIIPVGEQYGVQELVYLKRTETGIEKKEVLPVRFVPMTGEGVKREKEKNR